MALAKKRPTISHSLPLAVQPKFMRGKKPTGTINVPAGFDPHGYALICSGDCMAPDVRDGEYVLISPNTKVEPGMVAMFAFKEIGPKLKRLMSPLFEPAGPGSDCQQLITVAMNNPPKLLLLDPCKLDRVHAAIGVIRDGAYVAFKPPFPDSQNGGR